MYTTNLELFKVQRRELHSQANEFRLENPCWYQVRIERPSLSAKISILLIIRYAGLELGSGHPFLEHKR